jgi:hypothetical protein
MRSSPYCAQATKEQESLRKWAAGFFTGLKATDLALLVFTLLLVIVGHRQAEIYSSQRDIMSVQTSIQRELARPQIFLVRIRVTAWTGWIVLDGLWKNSGTTTAHNVRIGERMTIQPHHNLAADFDYGVTLHPQGIFGPGSEPEIPIVVIHEGSWRRTDGNREFLFVWGECRYEDRVNPGVVNVLEYCRRMRIEEGGVSFVVYGPHNRAYEVHTNQT